MKSLILMGTLAVTFVYAEEVDTVELDTEAVYTEVVDTEVVMEVHAVIMAAVETTKVGGIMVDKSCIIAAVKAKVCAKDSTHQSSSSSCSSTSSTSSSSSGK